MKQKLLLGLGKIFFIALALSSCSTATPIVSEWHNPTQTSGSFQRLMIAGPSGDVSVRRSFEDEFVAQLVTLGVDAVPSYRYVPDSEAITENSLKQAAQQTRADGLLSMRPVKVEEKTNYPTIGPEISFGIFGSNAGAGWSGIPGGSGPYRYNEYTSEIALYDLARNDLAWTGTIRAKEPSKVQTAIKSYVETVTKALAAQNLFPKK
ncbi:MAG: hypothetical protein ACTHMB_14930 [Candidatus Binatia bacterium]